MTLTVLVPDEEGLAALAGLDNVTPVVYNSAGRMPEEAGHAEVMVVPPFHADRLVAAMRDMPKLRLVQTLSAGIDRWEGRLPDGVALSNARGAHGGSTAEWAVAALLSIYRAIPRWVADQAAHAWQPVTTESLDGKRILILGAGDLGSRLRAMLQPFGTAVTMAARTPRDGIHGIGEVPGLLGSHDAVVVMVPYNDGTYHLVDKAFLGRMPDGAVLVNAARGPVVDTSALLDELNAGRLRAALDVTDPEPLPADHPLWDAPGLLITPHVGGNTAGVTARGWAVAATQIAAFAAGRQPENLC
ncbi:MAG TPA: 2-hydroxyacid dehydrogenase [Streptosporangiaceae bacterium]|jgi:phosphoglycerate dehydrogenase-like enzyme|nr:2-hydroxyacid dehydrogenase [Streptosporangiaceae bacterium]